MAVQSPAPVHQGKVRDIYEVPGHPELLALVTSDRVSAFDDVLSTPIPGRGELLTRLTQFWLTLPEIAGVAPSHLVPDPPHQEWMEEHAGRITVVKRLDMIPLECIVRGHITGSAWDSYQKDGTVNGVELAAGLALCDRLPEPMFTPSTKALKGQHDENISVQEAVARLGADVVDELERLSLELYRVGAAHAEERGIVLLDTKFEFGWDPETGVITLGDEVMTPDSSRFVDATALVPGRPAPSKDKQIIRDWLTEESGWDRKSNSPPPPLPEEIVALTMREYDDIASRLIAA